MAVGISAEGLPYCLESSVLGNFNIKPGECGGSGEGWITIRFKFEAFECLYERASITGTYKSAPEAATSTISNNEFAWTGVGCGFAARR